MDIHTSLLKKETILIIESNQLIGDRLTSYLAQEGYVTILITKGSEGFTEIVEHKPDLVILDITLNGADGYQILAQKFADSTVKNIPVFLVSTQGVPINMRRVPEKSVQQFIVSMNGDEKDITARVNTFFKHDEQPVVSTYVTPSADKKKILWVEDDKLIGTILGKKLMNSGFNLLHATKGEDALKAVKTFTPDAIVMDLMLPGMSGFDIIQKFHMDDSLKNVPTMILTNSSKQSDIEKSQKLGVQKFFTKATLSLDQIVSEVRDLAQ
ncbi:MAG: response regulator [Candidatus Taylorbacteria bacterium]